MDSEMNGGGIQENWGVNNNQMIWIGVAVGAAIGIGIALSRRKKTRWDTAREMTRRVADHSSDLADSTKDLVERVRVIYEEGRKVVEEAGHLWEHGRKLVGV
jgi:gas vesicle protein